MNYDSFSKSEFTKKGYGTDAAHDLAVQLRKEVQKELYELPSLGIHVPHVPPVKNSSPSCLLVGIPAFTFHPACPAAGCPSSSEKRDRPDFGFKDIFSLA